MSSSENWLKFLLRFSGILGIMAILAVVMPQSWLVWCVAKVEPGLSAGFLVSYLARALSAFYFFQGILLLVFATDVKHYKIPIRFTAIWCIVAVLCMSISLCTQFRPALFHLRQYWFFWFVAFDGTFGLVTAVACLVLLSRKEDDG